MGKFAVLILIFLTGFFPQMPFVHSEGFLSGESDCAPISSHHDHRHEQDDTTTPTDHSHDMSVCTSIVDTISRSSERQEIETEGVSISHHSIYPTLFVVLSVENIQKVNYSPPPDPPDGSPQDLVGIVILVI